MSFYQIFLSNLLSSNKLTSTTTVSQKLPEEVINLQQVPSELLSLRAAGYISCSYPYHYELQNLPAYCVIYTVKGQGGCKLNGHRYTLTPGTLLFFHGRELHEIHAEKNSWEFYQLFLDESGISFYYEEYNKRHSPLLPFPESPYILSIFERLAAAPSSADKDSYLINHRLLTDLFIAAIVRESDAQDSSAPSYIREMKKIMDTQYSEAHSLSCFEEIFGISKYRLSREFRDQYKEPPMKYLNRRRIEEGKRLLQEPEMTVYEAGRQVGIDNTTHFIHLFQKYTGTTPAVYRRSLLT
jgi:AraC-like DNA-binding protein